MKKLFPLLALVLAVAFAASTLRSPKNPGAFDVVGFSRLPVLVNGRLKPIDTVARSSLLQLQGKQSVVTPDGRKPTPIEWLLDVCFRSDIADAYQVFEIVHPDVLALFSLRTEDGRDNKRFSYTQLSKSFAELDRQAKLANQVESAARTAFQSAVVQIYGNLVHYQRLRYSLTAPGREDFLGDLLKFQDQVGAGITAVRAKQAGQPHDEAAATAMTEIGERFVDMANISNLLVVPPDADNNDPNGWKPAGAALLDTFRTPSAPGA
jgi:hypothetical protein